MQYEFKSINDIALFHDLNQGDEKLTKMMCTFYAPAINLKYNCGIKLTEEDIKLIAKQQEEKGLFSYSKGARGSDGVEAIYNYVVKHSKERGWKIPNLITFKQPDETELLKWIDRGYSTVIGIKVSKEFYNDKQDGIINALDYSDLSGDIGHFTNITKWIGRGDESLSSYGKEMFIDSYFTKNSTYKCEIINVLEDLAMNTKYIFY